MAERTMRALVLRAVGDLRHEVVPYPTIEDGWAIVRVAAAGVCGSDIPRVFQHGTSRFPLIPGHEFSGVVEEVVGPGPQEPGTRVAVIPLIPCGHCSYCQIGAYGQCAHYDYLGSRRDGGFAEFVAVPQANLMPLPEGVDLIEAALTEPAAVALHAMRQGAPEAGDTVAILGTGPIGMILAQWAHILGAGRVLLVDVDERRLQLAARLGLGETCNARQNDPVAWAQAMSDGRGVDLAIEAAGVAATLDEALRIVRPLGRVVLMGNPAGDMVLPGATLSQVLRKQLTIRGTWNSYFADLPVHEWRIVLQMLAARRLELGPLISHRVPLAQGVAVLEMMRDQLEFCSRVLIIP